MRVSTYLINLDRSPDRLAFMQKQADALGMPFERIPAVDGQALSAAEVETYQRSADRPLTPGEIGCWLSHRQAWATFADLGEPWALVLEDDAVLSPELPRVLGDLSAIPPQADIVKIDTSPGVKVEFAREAFAIGARKLRRLRRNSWGSAGYLISRRVCVWLLDYAVMIDAPLDVYLFSPASGLFGSIATYVMDPALVVQEQHFARLNGRSEELASVIPARQEARRSTAGAGRKILREIARPFSQARAALAHGGAIDWR